MGLPRYVNNKYEEMLKMYMEGIMFFAQDIFKYGNIVTEFMDKQNKLFYSSKSENYRSMQYAVREKLKKRYSLTVKKDNFDKYSLELIEVDKYVRLKFFRDSLLGELLEGGVYEKILIKEKFRHLYDIIQLKKMNNDAYEYDENPLLYKIKNKEFLSRCFPSSLKQIIFNRDNFTCKVCKIHKDNLPEKIHLEIDHIIAWEDGGKTTYSNGQTICSDCNKGKHHTKKHFKIAV